MSVNNDINPQTSNIRETVPFEGKVIMHAISVVAGWAGYLIGGELAKNITAGGLAGEAASTAIKCASAFSLWAWLATAIPR